MKPSEVLEAIVTTIEAVELEDVHTDGAALRASIGNRKSRRPGRYVQILPGIPERIRGQIGDCEHELAVEILYYIPSAPGRDVRNAVDDSVSVLDALYNLSEIVGISSVDVESGRIAEGDTENEFEVYRSIRVRYIRS
jgi:hypothetical protein